MKNSIKEKHQAPEYDFIEKDKKVVLLHKPHPEDVMDRGAVSGLIEYLKEIGEL